MTDQPTPPDVQAQRSKRVARRAVILSVLRSVTIAVVGFILYFTLPFDSTSHFNTGVALFSGLVAVAALTVWQAWTIARSPFPMIRAVEGLITTFPLVVLLFATTYFVMDQ